MGKEAFVHVNIDRFQKRTDQALTDGYSMRFGNVLYDDGAADYTPCGWRGALEAVGSSANLSTDEPLGLCDASQSGRAERYR